MSRVAPTSVLRPMAAAAWLIVMVAGCGERPASSSAPGSSASSPSPASPAAAWFEDATARSGIEFRHEVGPPGDFWMPASIGSGGGVLDADGDGRLDVLLLQGAKPEVGARHQLFLQQTDGTFRNASAGSGLDVAGPGMGVAAGDVNNDGRPDVLITEVGRVRLLLNRSSGPGRVGFEDVTVAAGIENTRWGTSVSMLDYDRDGWLDIVVANYVDYSPTIRCYDAAGRPEFCGPQGMPGTAARLFRNRGAVAGAGAGARFEDVTVASGVAKAVGAGLGVYCADLDGDGWVDILMADDGMPNRLYVNRRDGTFAEEAVQRGLAFNAFGATVANMGIAPGDVDGDGLLDLFIPHVSWEQHALWRQGPAGLFLDQAVAAGLANLSLRGTGFGAVLSDFDGDGDLDLAWANGRIRRGELRPPFSPGLDPFWHAYAQPNQVLANDGNGRFQEVSAANPAFAGLSAVGRGLISADLDNDGGLDLLLMNTGGAARVLRNVAPSRGHWLLVRAIEPALGGRDACGAVITVTAGGRRWRRVAQPGYSYLVSNDPRVHFGLGAAAAVDGIEVTWPDGKVETFPGTPVDRIVTLRRGTGGKP